MAKPRTMQERRGPGWTFAICVVKPALLAFTRHRWIDGEKLTSTAEHPVYLPIVGRWVPAGEVRPGTLIRRADGSHARVERVKRWTVRNLRVYNLTVGEAHTFYAGATGGGVWKTVDAGTSSSALAPG